METYVFSMLLLVVIILAKVLLIACIYACRVKKQRELRQASLQARVHVTDGAAYPQSPYTHHSAIINYEEPPHTVAVVAPGETLAFPGQPPPYSIAVCQDKPPTYEQANMQVGPK